MFIKCLTAGKTTEEDKSQNMTPKRHIFPHTQLGKKWIKHQSNGELPSKNHALSQRPFTAHHKTFQISKKHEVALHADANTT